MNVGEVGYDFSGGTLPGTLEEFGTPDAVTVSGGLLNVDGNASNRSGVKTTIGLTWAGSMLTAKMYVGSSLLVGPYVNDGSNRYFLSVAYDSQVSLVTYSIASGLGSNVNLGGDGHEYGRLDFSGADMLFRTSADGVTWTTRETITGFDGSAYAGLPLCAVCDDGSTRSLDEIIATEATGPSAAIKEYYRRLCGLTD